MTNKEAMQMALEALEDWKTYMRGHWDVIDEQAITALRQALEQPADEPFSYFSYDIYLGAWVRSSDSNKGIPFYTRPQPKSERYFCERCGKRLFDGIHTCTPPADTLQEHT